jgi:hypothetical protein
MKERNDEIMLAYEAHPSHMPDAEFQAKVNKIVDEYHPLIVAEAKAFKASGEVEAPVPTPSSAGAGDQANVDRDRLNGQPTSQDNDDDDDDGDSTIVIIGVVAGCVALLLVFGILVMVYKMKGKTSAPAINTSGVLGGSAPYDGDSNVVMGRPVEGEAEAAQGAPVQQGSKGSAEDPTTNKV